MDESFTSELETGVCSGSNPMSVDQSFSSDVDTEIHTQNFMTPSLQHHQSKGQKIAQCNPKGTVIDQNQTVQLTANEYQLGLEAAREFTLHDFQKNYRTDRIVFDNQKQKR